MLAVLKILKTLQKLEKNGFKRNLVNEKEDEAGLMVDKLEKFD